jgi:3'(2'), 5'-bisphosphate nucleotidase
LVINVVAGEGWEKLCPFLGKPVPEIPFPKANVTQITWMNIDDIVAVARRAGRITLRVYQQRQTFGTIGKILYRLRGGDAGALQRASREAHEAIVDGLKKLNAQTAVLSREGGTIPYSERAHWNHLWLVDPLDGANAFLGSAGGFSVNIALIQDGDPIYGVVYAPVTDTVYYARIGKGAFKLEGNEAPRQLNALAAPGKQLEVAHERKEQPPMRGSRALAMCRVAEGQLESCTIDEPSREWETAAAHLIATNAGKRVQDCKSGQGLKYNTEHLTRECVIVEPAPGAA